MADAAERRFDVVLVYHTSVTQPLGEDPSDPSVFLAESIHEMFDEYYSVSLSFWTRTGLREKARQGHLVGSLPWGYRRDSASGLAVPDPARALLVLELFERYAGGQESDRSLAAWLNAKGALTARGRAFGKDTVREMLVNAAYCGYVGGLRSKDRSVRGLHEPLVPEELFDRVQEIRAWRTRVVKPGRPSEDYLLRKLLHCERCGSRMHGTRGSRGSIRRYICSTRRYSHDCAQPIVKAEPLEAQLVDWIRDFQPDSQLRTRARHTPRGGAIQRRRQRGAPTGAARPTRPTPRPLRTRRSDQEPIRAQAAGAPRRAGANIAAPRPASRAGRDAAIRLRALLGNRALVCRTAETARNPLRPNLARRRPHRRRQAATAVRPLLQNGRTTQPPAHKQAGCQ